MSTALAAASILSMPARHTAIGIWSLIARLENRSSGRERAGWGRTRRPGASLGVVVGRAWRMAPEATAAGSLPKANAWRSSGLRSR